MSCQHIVSFDCLCRYTPINLNQIDNHSQLGLGNNERHDGSVRRLSRTAGGDRLQHFSTAQQTMNQRVLGKTGLTDKKGFSYARVQANSRLPG